MPQFSYPSAHIRFWSRIKFPQDMSDCWEWTGYLKKKSGYGEMYVDGKVFKIHRYSYEFLREPIPEGLVIDHLCRNRACVNPYHLEAVSSGENTLRGTSWTAVNHRLTHCKFGHPFSPENTRPRMQTNGKIRRICIFCYRKAHRDSARVRRARLRSIANG